MTAGPEVEWFQRVDEVPGWSDLASAASVHLGAGRLRTMEHLGPIYAAVPGGARARAAAVCHLVERDDALPWKASRPSFLFAPRGINAEAADESPPAVEDVYPFLLCGPAHGYSSRLLVDAGLDGDARRRAVRELAGAVRGLAERRGAKLYGFGFLPLEDATELLAADPELAPTYYAAEAYLPVASFDAYLGSLRNKARNTIKREVRQFAEEGLRFEARRLADVLELFARLGTANVEKYGGTLDLQAMRRAGERWVRAAEDRDTVICVMRGDSAVGFGLFVRHGATLFATGAGFEPDLPKRAAAYFNCLIYEGLRLGEREGAAAVHYGIGAITAKVSRGCRCRPLVCLVGGPSLSPALRRRLVEGGRARLREDEEVLRGILSEGRLDDVLPLAPVRDLLARHGGGA